MCVSATRVDRRLTSHSTVPKIQTWSNARIVDTLVDTRQRNVEKQQEEQRISTENKFNNNDNNNNSYNNQKSSIKHNYNSASANLNYASSSLTPIVTLNLVLNVTTRSDV